MLYIFRIKRDFLTHTLYMKHLRKIAMTSIILFVGLVFSAFKINGTDFTLTIKAGTKEYFFAYPQIDVLNGELYLKGLDGVVEEIYYDTLIRPIEAEMHLEEETEGKFVYKNEQSGLGINKEKTKEGILRSLKTKSSVLEISYEVILPKITVSQLKTYTHLRGSFSTDYSFSSPQRKSNINLAAHFLTCTKIDDGEVFSFNDTVGERSEERGFQKAKIIMDGKYVDGVGGGVCQVSTTLYNALLLSGIFPTEWHRHTLKVSYVEAGFDAMVNETASDLKFKNETGGLVFIETVSHKEGLTVNIYGKKNEYKYERFSVVEEVIDPDEYEIIFNKELSYGQENIIQIAKNGLKSSSYLKIYKDGKFIKTKKLRTDVYKPIRGIKEVGLA